MIVAYFIHRRYSGYRYLIIKMLNEIFYHEGEKEAIVPVMQIRMMRPYMFNMDFDGDDLCIGPHWSSDDENSIT